MYLFSLVRFDLPDSYKVSCLNGRRHSEIEFTCKSNTLGEPIFIGEPQPCFYMFSWATAAACPVTSQIGVNCSVFDESSGSTIDLSHFPHDLSLQTSYGKIQFAICGRNHLCDGTAGLCLENSGAGGRTNAGQSQIVKEGDSIFIKFSEGDSCPSDRSKQLSAVVQLECGAGWSGMNFAELTYTEAGPRLISERDGCSFLISYSSPEVCIKKLDLPCIAVDNMGGERDLTGLKLLGGNWEVLTPDGGKSSLHINVCRNLNTGFDTFGCPPDQAGCWVSFLYYWSNWSHSFRLTRITMPMVWDIHPPQLGKTGKFL